MTRGGRSPPWNGASTPSGADYSMGYIDGEYVITSELEGASHSSVVVEEPAAGVRIEVVGRVVRPGRVLHDLVVAVGVHGREVARVVPARDPVPVDPPALRQPAEAEVLASGRAKRSAIGVRQRATALELASMETGSEAASLTLTANGVELARVRDRGPLLYVTGVGLFVASTSGGAAPAFDDLLVEVLD